MTTTPPVPPAPLDYEPQKPKVYTCGTLTYTKSGLFALFAWLLWGDFVFTLFETVGPSVIPLKLKALGASNTTMQIILSTLPAILNITVCPWVSYKSDRHRGRMGRRIPFILYTLPFLAVALVLVGWSETMTPWIQKTLPGLHDYAPTTVTIGLIAIFYVIFSFFNMFVGSVFWYLFNDVVPPQFLGRFTGLFRLVGTGAGFFYQFVILKYAESHMREILTGAALLYCVGFLMVCFMIKEGKYPPPAEPSDTVKKVGRIAGLIEFFRQSFSSKIYLYVFLTTTFATMAGATGMFNIFFSKEMGLTLEQIGWLGGIGMLGAFVATYFTAVYVDRWHPMRVAAYTGIFSAISGFGAWVWIFVTLPGSIYFWLSLGGGLMTIFSRTLAEAAFLPLCMRTFPKSLYGQFCSAQAMTRSFGTMLAGVTAGILVDLLMRSLNGSDAAYRFIFIWPWVCHSAAAVCFYLAYREWKRLGADDHYQPPAPWLPEGVEEVVDKVPSVAARPRIVMLALWLGFLGAVLSLVLSVGFIYLMHRHRLDFAANWYTWSFMPLKILLTLVALIQLVQIKRDMNNIARGLATRYGVPHHGVLMVNSIQGLLYFPIFWFQTIWMIEVDREGDLFFFGYANLLSMLAGIIGLQIIRYMERPTPNPAHPPHFLQKTPAQDTPSLEPETAVA